MNKILSYSIPVLLVAILFLQIISFGGGRAAGGISNFDSLDLRPEVSGDNALVVRNSSGVAQFTIDGSGVTTLVGATSLSSSLTVAGESNLDTLIQGGDITLFNSSVAAPTAAQVCDSSVFSWTLGVGDNGTLTLPAEDDLDSDCLAADGDMLELIVINTSSNSASTVTITAGASTTLVGPSSTDDIINGGNSALLKFLLLPSSELWVSVVEYVDAD